MLQEIVDWFPVWAWIIFIFFWGYTLWIAIKKREAGWSALIVAFPVIGAIIYWLKRMMDSL